MEVVVTARAQRPAYSLGVSERDYIPALSRLYYHGVDVFGTDIQPVDGTVAADDCQMSPKRRPFYSARHGKIVLLAPLLDCLHVADCVVVGKAYGLVSSLDGVLHEFLGNHIPVRRHRMTVHFYSLPGTFAVAGIVDRAQFAVVFLNGEITFFGISVDRNVDVDIVCYDAVDACGKRPLACAHSRLYKAVGRILFADNMHLIRLMSVLGTELFFSVVERPCDMIGERKIPPYLLIRKFPVRRVLFETLSHKRRALLLVVFVLGRIKRRDGDIFESFGYVETHSYMASQILGQNFDFRMKNLHIISLCRVSRSFRRVCRPRVWTVPPP